METSMIYWLILYTAYVVIPVVPSYIIYKNFPTTTVGAKGMLAGLKINATGAFAAYLITSILGLFIVKQVLGLIEDVSNKV